MANFSTFQLSLKEKNKNKNKRLAEALDSDEEVVASEVGIKSEDDSKED